MKSRVWLAVVPDDWRGVGHKCYGKIARYYPCVVVVGGKVVVKCDSTHQAKTYISNSPELAGAFVARVPFRAMPAKIRQGIETMVRREQENDWW